MSFQPKNILIVQVGKIGDMVLTTPLFSGIKKIFPDCNLFVLSSEKNNKIAANHSDVFRTIIYKKKIFSIISLLFKLRRIKFDFWIDTKDEVSSTSKFFLKWGKYVKSIGFNVESKLFDVSLNDFVKGNHYTDINISPAYYFDKDYTVNHTPSINIPSGVQGKYDNILNKLEGSKILINISAGSSTRYWEKENWYDLINNLDEKSIKILIAENKDEEAVDYLSKNITGKNLYFLSANSIFEVAEIIRNCDYVISPDTSIVHIASCFNKPIVALFHNEPRVLERYSPLSDKRKVIISKETNSFEGIESADIIRGLEEIMK